MLTGRALSRAGSLLHGFCVQQVFGLRMPIVFLRIADYRAGNLYLFWRLPMSEAHAALITRFYQAFQRLDAEAMAACYTDDVVFSDPAFGELRGRDAGDMWRMLTTRAKDFSLTFDHVRSDGSTGSAH